MEKMETCNQTSGTPSSTTEDEARKGILSESGVIQQPEQSSSAIVMQTKTTSSIPSECEYMSNPCTLDAATLSQNDVVKGKFIGPYMPTRSDGVQSQRAGDSQNQTRLIVFSDVTNPDRTVVEPSVCDNAVVSIDSDQLSCPKMNVTDQVADCSLLDTKDFEPASKRIKVRQDVCRRVQELSSTFIEKGASSGKYGRELTDTSLGYVMQSVEATAVSTSDIRLEQCDRATVQTAATMAEDTQHQSSSLQKTFAEVQVQVKEGSDGSCVYTTENCDREATEETSTTQ